MILQAKNLRTHYGHGGYLSNISFTLEPGEILFIRCRVLLLGSVLLRTLMGMADEAKGEVWFEQENLLAPPQPGRLLELRRQMAMVYRTRGLISLLNVEQNIAPLILSDAHALIEGANRLTERLKPPLAAQRQTGLETALFAGDPSGYRRAADTP
jgi:ABC-type transporter Mla maintaining outer membrane lipid asymmetry ATPase subunit MlaF